MERPPRAAPDPSPTRPRRSPAVLIAGLAWVSVWALGLGAVVPAAVAQDELTVGAVLLARPGDSLEIPLYVRDRSGSVLGSDQGPGRTVQSLALSVVVSPAEAVSLLTLSRFGATAAASPTFAEVRRNGPVRSLIAAFDELADPLVLTLDPPFPGQPLARIDLVLAPDFDQGQVTLALVPGTTALGNSGGTLLERPGSSQLVTRPGTVGVDSTGLFADGFESGDIASWSSAVP